MGGESIKEQTIKKKLSGFKDNQLKFLDMRLMGGLLEDVVLNMAGSIRMNTGIGIRELKCCETSTNFCLSLDLSFLICK